jgi:hypothetical protein
MNGYTLAAIALICFIVVMLAFWFRERLKLSLKGYGLSFAAEGRNAPPAERIAAIASGERAAAVGGSLEGEILTGDRGEADRKGVKSTSPPKSSSAQTKSAPPLLSRSHYPVGSLLPQDLGRQQLGEMQKAESPRVIKQAMVIPRRSSCNARV